MDTIKFDNKENIKMIAHRGVSGLERENTCPAFVVAGSKSYYGIETDVRVTKDGKYVLFHDEDLTRLFGIEKRPCECTFDELRALRLKDVDEKTERNDLFLPTLTEYLSICKKYDKQAILELKGPLTVEQIGEITEIIKEYGWLERTTFISFSKDFLLCLREKCPMVEAQYLDGTGTEEDLQFLIENKMDADFHWKRLTKEFIDKMHAAGRKVNCWTVNSLSDANTLKELGVDFITTNILE